MYQNIRELPDIVELAHKLGVDRVKACFMVLRAPHMMSQSLWFHKELTNEYLSKAEVLARSYGIRTKFYKKFDLAGNYQTTENIREIDCRFLWEEAWIRINGDVVPCCNIDSPIVGNIHKEPFDAIWNNDIYQDMRKRTGSGEFYECCKYCILPNEDVRGDTFNYPYKSLVLI